MRTRLSIGLRFESTAGENFHVRTASTTTSVYGGVARSTSTAPTAPAGETATDSTTSPPASALGGILMGIEPSMNRAASRSACARARAGQANTMAHVNVSKRFIAGSYA